jgi:starch phosphorylase
VRTDNKADALMSGDNLKIEVAARLGDLTSEDVVLECVIGTESGHEEFSVRDHIQFTPSGINSEGDSLFELDLAPPFSGLQFYKIRLYPNHRLLCHPFETGRIIWL